MRRCHGGDDGETETGRREERPAEGRFGHFCHPASSLMRSMLRRIGERYVEALEKLPRPVLSNGMNLSEGKSHGVLQLLPGESFNESTDEDLGGFMIERDGLTAEEFFDRDSASEINEFRQCLNRGPTCSSFSNGVATKSKSNCRQKIRSGIDPVLSGPTRGYFKGRGHCVNDEIPWRSPNGVARPAKLSDESNDAREQALNEGTEGDWLGCSSLKELSQQFVALGARKRPMFSQRFRQRGAAEFGSSGCELEEQFTPLFAALSCNPVEMEIGGDGREVHDGTVRRFVPTTVPTMENPWRFS